MSANVSKSVKRSDYWKHSQHVPTQVSALLKLGELGVFLRLRMCFTFMVPLNKQKKGTAKQVLIFLIFEYQWMKRTCCSLEVAFQSCTYKKNKEFLKAKHMSI